MRGPIVVPKRVPVFVADQPRRSAAPKLDPKWLDAGQAFERRPRPPRVALPLRSAEREFLLGPELLVRRNAVT